MDDIFELGRREMQRIARATRSKERDAVGGTRAMQAGVGMQVNPHRLVMVSSTTANGAGLYPGVQVARTQSAVQDPDPARTFGNTPPGYVSRGSAVGNYQPYGGGSQDCWIEVPSGFSPAVNDVYNATPTSVYTDGLAVFRASATAPGLDPVFVGSGASHAAGDVPDPGSVAGTSRFLREDALWAVPGLAFATAQVSISFTAGSFTIVNWATGTTSNSSVLTISGTSINIVQAGTYLLWAYAAWTGVAATTTNLTIVLLGSGAASLANDQRAINTNGPTNAYGSTVGPYPLVVAANTTINGAKVYQDLGAGPAVTVTVSALRIS